MIASVLYGVGGYDETKPNNNIIEYSIAELTTTGWVIKTLTGAEELIEERPATFEETAVFTAQDTNVG